MTDIRERAALAADERMMRRVELPRPAWATEAVELAPGNKILRDALEKMWIAGYEAGQKDTQTSEDHFDMELGLDFCVDFDPNETLPPCCCKDIGKRPECTQCLRSSRT